MIFHLYYCISVANYTMNPSKNPNVLCISGHDPSGGAGIQADIEAINSCGAHALSIISCTTVQDSQQVYQVIPSKPAIIKEQITKILADSHLHAIKIGLISCTDIIDIIASTVDPLPNTPIILDPVFSSGGSNQSLTTTDLVDYLKLKLLHLITVITPNTNELQLLTGEKDFDTAAKILINKGIKYVLLTGTHDESTKDVVNTLYSATNKQQWAWPRLDGIYHGSGCTLASSLSTYLAQGVDENEAFYLAQQFTWQSLNSAYHSGKGQLTPNRIKKC